MGCLDIKELVLYSIVYDKVIGKFNGSVDDTRSNLRITPSTIIAA
jgi:hypothetical protein